jgi:hypothetical protein
MNVVGEQVHAVRDAMHLQRHDARTTGINERCGHTATAVDRARVDISNVTHVSREFPEFFYLSAFSSSFISVNKIR